MNRFPLAFLFWLALIVPCHCSESQSGKIHGMITEVAPAASGEDFVEIFVAGPSNLGGVKLYQNDKRIKFFPSVTPKSGPFGNFIILHAGSKTSGMVDETDVTGDKNFDGVIDLYADTGLNGSTNANLTLKNPDGTIVDFVSWSAETADNYLPSKQTAYDQAASSGDWFPSCNSNVPCYLSGSVPWKDRAENSLSRKVRGDGFPQKSDPPSVMDWILTRPSPGKGYGPSIQPKRKLLEIFQSPFSPSGGGRFNEAVIGYKISANSAATIQIFNVMGQLIRTLTDRLNSLTNETQLLTWDGRDFEGRIVPVGVYVVRIEVQNPNGTIDADSKTVVVGRKL